VLVARDKCDAALKAVHRGFNLDAESVAAPTVGVRQKRSQVWHIGQDELVREVVSRLAHMEDIVVSEVQLDSHQSRVTLRNLPDVPGVAAAVFTAAAEGAIMVDMIVQNVGHDGQSSLSFTVPRPDLDSCLLLIREVTEQWPEAELSFDRDIAKLTVMGIGLRSHTGVGDRMFRALAEAEINIQIINTSEIRMSAVVASESGEKAHMCLMQAFGLPG
jgi:aspartate kinase